LKIRKQRWARLSAAFDAHLRAPARPGSPPARRPVGATVAGRRRLQCANSRCRLNSLETLLFPFPTRTRQRKHARASALLPLLYSRRRLPPRSPPVSRSPEPSGRRREHCPHSFSPFEQGPASRSAPSLGSQAVSAAATLPLVRSSAAHDDALFPCARAVPHPQLAYCPGFGSAKSSMPPRLELPPPSLRCPQ
jgi:hypothetical protein